MGATVGASDPHFASVALLALNNNKPNGTTTFLDQSSFGRAIVRMGTLIAYSTAQKPAGMVSSGLFPATDPNALNVNNIPLGAGDFTLEYYVRFASLGAGAFTTYDGRDQTAAQINGIVLQADAGSNLKAYFHFTNIATVAGLTSAWQHHAMCSDSGTIYFYVDGAPGASVANTFTLINPNNISIGAAGDFTSSLDGNMASFRITLGVARYPGGIAFTPPRLPLPTHA